MYRRSVQTYDICSNRTSVHYYVKFLRSFYRMRVARNLGKGDGIFGKCIHFKFSVEYWPLKTCSDLIIRPRDEQINPQQNTFQSIDSLWGEERTNSTLKAARSLCYLFPVGSQIYTSWSRAEEHYISLRSERARRARSGASFHCRLENAFLLEGTSLSNQHDTK